MGWNYISVKLQPLISYLSVPPDDMWLNTEQPENDIDRGKWKDSKKNQSQCHFVHHKTNMDCPGSKSRSQWSEYGN
jgi:hypothetical protein